MYNIVVMSMVAQGHHPKKSATFTKVRMIKQAMAAMKKARVAKIGI